MPFWIATLDSPLTQDVSRQIWLDLQTGWYAVVDEWAGDANPPRPVSILLTKDPTAIPSTVLSMYPMIATYTAEGAKAFLAILGIDPEGRGPAEERQRKTQALVRQRRGGGEAKP